MYSEQYFFYFSVFFCIQRNTDAVEFAPYNFTTDTDIACYCRMYQQRLSFYYGHSRLTNRLTDYR